MKENNSHQKLVAKALKRQDVKKAYDELEEEFSLLAALVQTRQIAGKTQTEAKPLNFTQCIE
jgi:hypothetical protein